MVVFEDGPLGWWLGHEDRTLMNGINAFITGVPENFLAPSAIWGHSEKMASYESEEGSHQTTALLAPSSWISQPLTPGEIDVYCL